MRILGWTIASALLALLASCGGGNGDLQNSEQVTLDAVYGSTLDGVQLEQDGDSVTLTYAGLPAEGRMLRLNLPQGITAGSTNWSGDEKVIRLVAPVEQGAEIGVVP